MSQMTAATTVAVRAPRNGQRPLQVVTAADSAGTLWFPLFCVALLLAGLAAVLGLNTAMAQDSFAVGALEARSAQLTDTEESLTHEVTTQAAPQNLARRATRMGMVPADTAAFVDLRRGKVLGVATAAKKPAGLNVEAAATATTSGAPVRSTAGPSAGATKPQAKPSTGPSSTKKQSTTKKSSTTKPTTKKPTARSTASARRTSTPATGASSATGN